MINDGRYTAARWYLRWYLLSLCASNRLRDAARRIVLRAVGHPRLEQFHVGLLAPRCLEFLNRDGSVLLSVLRDDVHGAPLHVRPYHSRSDAKYCTNAATDVHDFLLPVGTYDSTEDCIIDFNLSGVPIFSYGVIFLVHLVGNTQFFGTPHW